MFSLLALFATTASSIPLEPPPVWLFEWSADGDAESQFSFGIGGAVDSLGNVYATDAGHDRLQKFDSEGNFERMWGWGVDDGTSAFQVCTSGCQTGITGSGAGQFDSPGGLAVSASGTVYVADESNARIQLFDSDGTFVATWGWGVSTGASTFEICTSNCLIGLLGTGDGQFGSPQDVSLDIAGNVYVTDDWNSRIQVFDSSGTFLRKWGSYGTGDGQFQGPTGIAVSESGYVYATEGYGDRVQKFDMSGNFKAKWGTTCDTEVAGETNCDGGFDSPIGVALDAAGNVYVVDSNNHRMQKFDRYGNFLSKWGTLGSGSGTFWWPYDVAISPLASGHIYVIEGGNRLIQVFGGPWMEFWVGEPVPQPE